MVDKERWDIREFRIAFDDLKGYEKKFGKQSRMRSIAQGWIDTQDSEQGPQISPENICWMNSVRPTRVYVLGEDLAQEDAARYKWLYGETPFDDLSEYQYEACEREAVYIFTKYVYSYLNSKPFPIRVCPESGEWFIKDHANKKFACPKYANDYSSAQDYGRKKK